MDPPNPINGQTALRLEPTTTAASPLTDPAVGAVVQVLVNAHPSKLAQRDLVARVQVAEPGKYGDKRTRAAADQAEAKGLVNVPRGAHGARLYELATPPSPQQGNP
jgi:hypothetical protein